MNTCYDLGAWRPGPWVGRAACVGYLFKFGCASDALTATRRNFTVPSGSRVNHPQGQDDFACLGAEARKVVLSLPVCPGPRSPTGAILLLAGLESLAAAITGSAGLVRDGGARGWSLRIWTHAVRGTSVVPTVSGSSLTTDDSCTGSCSPLQKGQRSDAP
jgi:hypothetical protein